MRRLLEIKHKISGKVCEYSLELFKSSPEFCVGRWIAPKGNPYAIPAGAVSWGVWPIQTGGCWGAYRLHRPDGTISSYRFDAVERISFTNLHHLSMIEYHDLVVDAIVVPSPDGDLRVTIEDRDELNDYVDQNAVSAEQLKIIAEFETLATLGMKDLIKIVDTEIDGIDSKCLS
mmetsp:Transcript_9655/g.15846  ORF Transcript_9655/g.15846 Transcript_9655/m.15846 type:complete len:174 (-) Transcript_9655:1454-1975(-)